ncbi:MULTISPECIES: glucosylglycerol 3-phosphatase [Spirulina sp. CCY15215]|uniref:glucosylglycerol 3-phosphatase n=1 Tax=Spirulina sp. CCY15215 TaxID=2767591 RepID=UPI00194E4419|nr:glucosylglycerol 3-phosphatase [Spirulina major]
MLSATLSQSSFSLKHDELARVLTQTKNLLIIQDLDGVCMGLVKDPLTRVISTKYVEAVRSLKEHFSVLTNGEYIGKRGVNGIIERAFNDAKWVREEGLYLPGLGAGGAQWQDCYGNVSHPGVSDRELTFLAQIPQRIREQLHSFFQTHSDLLADEKIEMCIDASVLDNKVSPTVNLNTIYEAICDRTEDYIALQRAMKDLIDKFLQEAAKKGLQNSFFVHYAPNLGRDETGQEIVRFASQNDSGTTDFQFMLQGAVKEAGVLAILNLYYWHRTGNYPLGKEFSVRQAPKTQTGLLQLIRDNFNPQEMPLLVGVGDTVNSTVEEKNGKIEVRRGGSDRNFLQLIQAIGKECERDNIVVYVDSSHGEVKNRKSVRCDRVDGELKVIEGPCDPRDVNDPLILNVVFPEGYQQYCQFFQIVARDRNFSG